MASTLPDTPLKVEEMRPPPPHVVYPELRRPEYLVGGERCLPLLCVTLALIVCFITESRIPLPANHRSQTATAAVYADVFLSLLHSAAIVIMNCGPAFQPIVLNIGI